MAFLPKLLKKSSVASMQRLDVQGKSGWKRGLGDAGEEMAARHLMAEGFTILARNVRLRSAEIDIIAEREGEVHFVEVKTRSQQDYGSPLDSITQAKQRRMRKAAEWYVEKARKNFKHKFELPCYLSVISVDVSQDPPEIECILDAFE